MKKIYSFLWAGTDGAFDSYLHAGHPERMAGYVIDREEDEDEDEADRKCRLLSVQDGVGIISIRGTLTDRDAWFNEFAGLVSYNEVRQAMYEAVSSPEVKEILMDIASGGGTVSGVLDAVTAVALAASVKRMTVYTDSAMMSAAYWLAAPAAQRFVSPVASVGSIGVVAKHVEYSKMAEDMGIKETIVRDGSHKQLINASEPLSEEAKAELQAMVTQTKDVFVKSVTGYLGKPLSAEVLQSREFIGAKAVDVGLADGLSSFDDVFAAIQKRVANINNQGGIDMKKKYAMAPALAMAAAASGVNLEAAPALEPTPEELAAAEVAEAEKVAAEAAAEAEKVAAEAAAADKGAADPAVVELLKSQVKEKDAELFTAKTELAALKAEADVVGGLKTIAAQAINNMQIALGGTADDTLAQLDAKSLVSRHLSTQARFIKEFKIGGVSAAGGEAEETPAVTAPSRIEAATMKVVKLHNK